MLSGVTAPLSNKHNDVIMTINDVIMKMTSYLQVGPITWPVEVHHFHSSKTFVAKTEFWSRHPDSKYRSSSSVPWSIRMIPPHPSIPILIFRFYSLSNVHSFNFTRGHCPLLYPIILIFREFQSHLMLTHLYELYIHDMSIFAIPNTILITMMMMLVRTNFVSRKHLQKYFSAQGRLV